MTRVAFYAPMKHPDHPSPSGDRAMARLLRDALRVAGFAPEVASTLSTREATGDARRQAAIRDAARAEADRLVARWRLDAAALPRLWLTYHSYYKAPDWTGPRAAGALGIPYVLVEASRAGKRAGGPFDTGHIGAEAALEAAQAIFVLTAHDREALARAGDLPLTDLPPFVDRGMWGRRSPFRPAPDGPVRLVTVAMMRAGDKLASYRILADALRGADARSWTLDVAGDGPARSDVGGLFAPFGPRVRFHGQMNDAAALRSLLEASDLLVWPAVNEAYGMALLEAQAAGCPVLVGRHGGVASALRPGRTGILCEPGGAAFAAALAGMLRSPGRLPAMGRAAVRFIVAHRGLEAAAERLRAVLQPLLRAPGEG